MTVKKPAFIYSVIVETLKAAREATLDHEDVPHIKGLDLYTATVVVDMCNYATADDSDLKNFRGTCEWILETILRLRRDSIPMISPTCRHRLVKEGLMIESDDLESRPKELLGAAFTKNN